MKMPPIRKNNSAPNKKSKAQTCEPSSPPPTDRGFSLRRGKACHICRKKKLRCDGVRPVCGYCQRRNRQCEFDDPETWGKQRQLQYQVEDLTVKLEAARQESTSLTQALEGQKALNQRLQCQIHPMLLVHNEPVLGLTLNDDIPQAIDVVSSQPRAQQEFGIAFDSPSFTSSTELSSPLSSIDAIICPDISFLQGQEPPSPAVDPINFSQFDTSTLFDLKLTEKSQSILLQAFFPHLPQCCLDISKAEVLSRFTQGGVQALQDCLLYAFFTMSCRFATEHSQVRRHESRFRQRAQFALRPKATILSRKEVFDSVRAAIVLALFFKMEDCLKEASTYVAVAFGYLLELDKAEDRADICEVARECTPEERLVFQCAYIVDRFIATQLQSPAIFPEEIKHICCADQASNSSGVAVGTQNSSIASQPTTPLSSPGANRPPLEPSLLVQLRMRCASLMYNVGQSIKLYEVNALLTEARGIRGALPSIYITPSSSMPSNVDLTILSMHTQVFSTLTRLTRRVSPHEGKCLEMAGEVVALIHELRDEDFVLLDFIVGLCWEWTIDTILGELPLLSRRPDQQSVWTTRVQFIIGAMKKLAAHIPIVSVNIANVALQCRAWDIIVL